MSGGITVSEKITVKLTGKDGNIFNLVGITFREMKKNNQNDEAEKMKKEVFSSGSYEEALSIIMKYVNVE